MEIRKLGIIGGGRVGGSIAERVAANGIEVSLVEVSPDKAARAERGMARYLDQEIAKWGITESEKKVILSKVEFTSDIERVNQLPVVIEAIHDHVEDKKTLLARLHEVCAEETVLVTNTSTLSITELATACGRPDRVIGMHFMYPMSWSPIVEVVRGMDTSDETFVRAQALARQLGKRVVQVYDSPGYVTTRGILPLLNEAIHMVMEGVASVEDIDKAMRLGYEFRMGPLEYCDRVGLDKVIGWMDHLFQEFGDSKYRPCPLLKKMVRAGHWGRRSGQGFYAWSDGQIAGSRQGEL